MTHLVLTFYLIEPIEHPFEVIENFKVFMDAHDIRGRVYINEVGINAQLSILATQAPVFFEWYLGHRQFEKTRIQKTAHFEHAFPRKTIKYRKELVALGKTVDLSKRGTHVSARQWQQMLDERDENTLILDVRNHYEWKVGHFEGAENPPYETFSHFPHFIDQIKGKWDLGNTRVLMYCTGGIRCEFYSCLIKSEGCDQVYQLRGGVMSYGREVGNAHWRGSLFVFDDRLVIPISEQRHEVISWCSFCNETTDRYHNCANVECNTLFLACTQCYRKLLGCCSLVCIHAPRRRQITDYTCTKPFRRQFLGKGQNGT